MLALDIDVLWGFRHVREFVEAYQVEILIPVVILTAVAQGWLHASFYNDRPGDEHGAAELFGGALFLLAYIAGLDVIHAYGSIIIGNFFFQMMINHAEGLPLIDPNERRRYIVSGKNWSWKRVFVGYGRWAKLAIGILLVFYQPLLQ